MCSQCNRGLKGLTNDVCPWCGGKVILVTEKPADPRVRGPVRNEEANKL